MVGGRVGRYLRVGVYTTFGLIFFTYYIPIKSACILAHLLCCSAHCRYALRLSRPPASPSWCRRPRRTSPPPPDWLGRGCCCCDWPPPSPVPSGPGLRTERRGWWAPPAGRGRGETRTHLTTWSPRPEAPPLTLGSGQSETPPSVRSCLLCPEQKTSWGAAWAPEQDK